MAPERARGATIDVYELSVDLRNGVRDIDAWPPSS